MAVEIPHIAFPFSRGTDGKVAVVEQDTVEHVMSCENVIVRCPLGFRVERPEFGWPFPEFQTAPLDLEALKKALDTFEPRGHADVTQWRDEAEQATQHVQIDVEVQG
jgi:phage baseplate assembly protein W